LRDVLPTAADWARSRWAIARGTVLGFAVGILPGAGPTIATFMSYTLEKKVSKHPEEFGHGAIEGVAAPESANNAAATGAMVPMLTLGIPGSATTAIASQYIANVMLLVLSTAFIPLFVRALRVPYAVLMPIIIALCVTGAYSLKNNVWDVGQMLVFGVLGYAMKKLGYSPAALVLALVLGPLAERALRQSLIISDAGIGIFFMRPIAAVLVTAALLAVLVPVARTFWSAWQRRADAVRRAA
jgi:putative tricarboxylic transport membrane protein